jgi:hypothetical protein
MHLHLILYLVAVALMGLASTVTITASLAGTYSKSWNVVSSADGDTTGSVSHGFGVAPALYWLVPLLPQAYGKQWYISAVSSTTITITGISSTSAGTSVAQLQIVAMLPHSIID